MTLSDLEGSKCFRFAVNKDMIKILVLLLLLVSSVVQIPRVIAQKVEKEKLVG